MEQKHTPGPWVLEWEDEGRHDIRMGSAVNSGSYQPQHRCEYDHGLYTEDGEQFEEAEANALLIAAAPDMLAALTAIQGSAGDIHTFCRENGIDSKAPDGTAMTLTTLADSIARWGITRAQGDPVTPRK